MALGDLAERRQPVAREQRERHLRLLGGRPEPVEGTVGRPGAVVWLVEIEARAEHAGTLFQLRDQRAAVRPVDGRIAEDREAPRMCFHGLNSLLGGAPIPKFARVSRTLRGELRNRRTLATL